MGLKYQILGILCIAAFCIRLDSTAAVCGIFSCILLAVSLVCAWKRFRNEQKLEYLCSYLIRVQDGQQLPELSGCREGNLGILESEIYKLVVRLKEQSAADKRQKEYLARMLSDISHQIKTPLTSITIMSDLLKEPELPLNQRIAFVEKMDSQINRILWLVRNLLTLSQLEADVLKLKREQINVRELLEKACAPFEMTAEVKEIQFCLQADEAMEMTCDIYWTTEAISNIIKNCMEHTPCGGKVSVCARQTNFSVAICITDNGEGIAKDDLAHIFERFYKGSNTKTDSVGIGLALSRQIIMQQNGSICVDSEPGEGTSFLVKLYSDVEI